MLSMNVNSFDLLTVIYASGLAAVFMFGVYALSGRTFVVESVGSVCVLCECCRCSRASRVA